MDIKEMDNMVDKMAADPKYKVIVEDDLKTNIVSVDATKPVLTSLGMHQTEDGWVFYKIISQGDKILEVRGESMPTKETAMINFKIVAQKLFMED